MADERDNKGAPTGTLATEALKEAGQHLLGLLIQRATEAASQQVAGLTDRLTDVTGSGGDLRSAFGGDRSRDDGPDAGSDTGNGGLTGALGRLKDKAATAISGSGGSGGGATKLKMTNVVESLDIALPLRTTYDLWTQFEDFPGFMKKVETVEQETDEKTNWTAKVFVSRRTWEATIIEQVPDSHIIWRSTGAKGHVDGAVTFTEVGPNLTRVLLVMEYWPKGLFEQTGNLWRAQGRRVRLEFKHFRRHAMTNVILRQQEVEGWRGEIRDSEVVKTHEDALKDEQQEGESAREETADREETPADEEIGREGSEPEEAAPDEDAEDERSDRDVAGDEDETEDEAYAGDEGDEGDTAYNEDEGYDENDENDEDEVDEEDVGYDEDDDGEAYDEEEPYAAEGEDTEQDDEYADEDEADAGEPVPARSGRR
jgi:uncharacterized membrane protein